MRIFISWSGLRSKKVADYLYDWLRKLPLPIEPWVSGAAIEPGTRWTKELSDALDGTDFGILCLTPENQDEPWICFEAGALSKAIEKAHVVPYLISMRPTELKHPLQQFHALQGNKEDTWRLISAIHRATGDQTRTEKDLIEVFDKWWPDLEQVIMNAQSDVHPSPEPKQPDLGQILAAIERISAVVESLSSRFTKYEQSADPRFVHSGGRQRFLHRYRMKLGGDTTRLEQFFESFLSDPTIDPREAEIVVDEEGRFIEFSSYRSPIEGFGPLVEKRAEEFGIRVLAIMRMG
jgi:hypothetical protein